MAVYLTAKYIQVGMWVLKRSWASAALGLWNTMLLIMEHYVTHLGNRFIIYQLKSLHLHEEAISPLLFF
jgi:hypothetical protein